MHVIYSYSICNSHRLRLNVATKLAFQAKWSFISLLIYTGLEVIKKAIYLLKSIATDKQNNANKIEENQIFKSDICIIMTVYTEHEDSL